MEFSAAYKKNIEREIVEAVANNLEQGELQEKELPYIADFVLAKIDRITNHEELVEFLKELSAKWPIFSLISGVEEGKERKLKEAHVTAQVLHLAKGGNIEDAIKLAQTMTKSQQQ